MNILVMMSTYNGEKYIEEQICSILEQEGVSIKLLIRDDGSSDSTTSIIEKLSKKYEHKISLITGDNVGFGESFYILTKKAFSLDDVSNFQYFAFSDQDDVWKKNKLIKACLFIKDSESAPYPILYCSSRELVDNNLSHIGITGMPKSIDKKRAILSNVAAGCTCVFNYSLLKEFVRTFNKSLIYHDYWLFILAFYLGHVYCDENSYILYRQHKENITGRQQLTSFHKIKRTFKSISKKPSNIESKMAENMLRLYSDELDTATKNIIYLIANYRHSFHNKVKLLTDSSLYSHDINFIDFLIFKFRILFNRL